MRMAVLLGGATLATAVIGLPRDAVADEALTLDYHLVVHVTEVETVAAPGRPGTVVGIASFRGIAVFDDGRIAHHAYAGGFDFVDGAGDFHGYAQWVFADGSRLDSRYVGTAEPLDGGGITFTGTHAEVTGSGEFAGYTGKGSFKGRRIDLLVDDGETYQRGQLTLTRSEN